MILSEDKWGIVDNYVNKPLILCKTMFIGEYSYTIDHKRRLSIPSKFRVSLGKDAVVTKQLEKCLVLYSMKGWGKYTEKLEKLPGTQINARKFSRIILSGASEVNFDKLGRILIPDYLREYADLKKNVIIIGLSDKIEIWDEVEWKKYRTKTEKELGDVASKLEELEI